MRKTLSILVLCICVATSVFAAQPGENDEGAARQIFDEANEARAAEGLPPLAWDDRLAQSALDHNQYMIRWGKLSHDLPGEPPLRKRIAKTNLRLNRSGENVAYNSDLDRVHQGFMRSPGHRSNIMSPDFNSMGVSVIRSGDVYWVTQNFAWRLDEISTSTAEDKVARAVERHFTERKLKRVQASVLDGAACDMARDDRVQPAFGWRVRGGRQSFAYTNADPSQLPSSVRNAQIDPEINSYAIGTCYLRSENFPSGTWWVLLVFIAGAQAS